MTNHTAETLSAAKTVELRKLAKSFGIQKLDRDGAEVSVNTGRKDELIANILRQQEFEATYVSAEGRTNPNLHPVYGWPIAGEQESTPAKKSAKAKKSAPAKADSSISPKALRFERDAKAAGWSALARVAADGSGISLVTATAPDGRTLELHWYGNVCVDGENYLTRTDGKRVKVRNASAARKVLADA